ncbi:MAG: caspase family protein, partial [Pseudomonadota bacterium]
MKFRFPFLRCAIAVLAVGVVTPALAEVHALILTISQYQGGVPPLAGVQQDGKSATAIARKMGVPEKNIVRLSDQQLTLAGMRRAFDDLTNRLQPNDQVFIYYSGHGSRTLVREQGAERCAESLVTVDADFLTDTEFEQRLKKLSQKADKVIAFLDACHSGGVTTRAVGGKAPAFSPKYWAKGGVEACAKPVNRLTRGLNANAKSAGSGARNFVYIAAARDNEISLDQPGKGGVATQA